MKVLVAHNRYRSNVPSGENVVVDAEIDALRRAGVDVVPFIRSSDEIDSMSAVQKLGVALGPVRSASGVHEFRALLDSENPDIVHVHNVFPLISPWILKEANRRDLPVAMTVHNFRLDCVAGTYLRGGHVCTECAGRSIATPALQHGCYRGSRVQTIPMVIGRSVHRDTWRTVSRFFALTEFHAEFLRGLGIADDRIVVRPTSVADPGEMPAPGRDVLFVGRLGAEKGVDVLLAAWKQSNAAAQGRRLHLVGDGDLRHEADNAAASDSSIIVHGSLDRDGVNALMRDCGPVVIPSTCFEGLPRVFSEAMAHGRPVMASDIGGLGRTADESSGWKVVAGDEREWAAALSNLTDADIHLRGRAARQRFLSTFDERTSIPTLLDTYQSVIRAHPQDPGAKNS